MSSDIILPEKVKETVNDIVRNEKYFAFDVEITPSGTNSSSYLSILFEATIKGETEKGSKEINLFIKYPIPTENQFVSMKNAFTSETFFYTELSKAYNQLQKEVHITDKDKYPVPKIYLSDTNILILENLKKYGYNSYNVTDVVSLEYAEMCLKQLAKFHALSFALEKRHPDYFEKNRITELKMPFDWSEIGRKYFFEMAEIVLHNLSGELKEKLESILTDVYEKLLILLEYRYAEHRCVCHGDYRMANVMALEVNGELNKVMPVDYQLLHYSDPVSDIIFFLTTCTDKKFRQTHQIYLKDIYYDSLKDCLEKFELNAETVYPRTSFEKSFKYHSVYSVALLILIFPYMYVFENQVPDFGNLEKCNLKPLFAERAYEILEEYFL